MPTVTRPDNSPRFDSNVNLYDPGPSSKIAIRSAIAASLPVRPASSLKREPRLAAGFSSALFLVSVLAGRRLFSILARLLVLLALLSGFLAGLLTLLVLLAGLATLLRLRLVVVVRIKLQNRRIMI
jgi:hypothetical protein